eukprot:7702302-Pyramimonas_sp.AAC.1
MSGVQLTKRVQPDRQVRGALARQGGRAPKRSSTRACDPEENSWDRSQKVHCSADSGPPPSRPVLCCSGDAKTP